MFARGFRREFPVSAVSLEHSLFAGDAIRAALQEYFQCMNTRVCLDCCLFLVS
jgi:hypothetical protein